MKSLRILLIALGVFSAQPLAAHVFAPQIAADLVSVAAAGGEQGSERLVFELAQSAPRTAATYGPFRVIDGTSAALFGITDTASPEQFAAMLRDYPGIATIEMVNCPGTEDDRANLRLGRMIRARGMAVHVPERGFVASGGVDLFVAGARRSADPSAEFAVHSWLDDTGREPDDYAPDAPENRAYLDYYRAVGMTASEARAFYAMTNSVPFENPKWLTRAELAQWVRLDGPAQGPDSDAPAEMPVLAVPVILAALDSVYTLQ
jgi:hypothetical protein